MPRRLATLATSPRSHFTKSTSLKGIARSHRLVANARPSTNSGPAHAPSGSVGSPVPAYTPEPSKEYTAQLGVPFFEEMGGFLLILPRKEYIKETCSLRAWKLSVPQVPAVACLARLGLIRPGPGKGAELKCLRFLFFGSNDMSDSGCVDFNLSSGGQNTVSSMPPGHNFARARPETCDSNIIVEMPRVLQRGNLGKALNGSRLAFGAASANIFRMPE